MTPIFSRTWRGCRATSKPATNACPSVGGINVVSILTIVVLPAPLGPSSPKTSPRRTSKLTLSTAVNAPKRLVSSLVCIAGDSGSIVPRKSDFRGHPGLELAFRLQHLHLHVERADILTPAAHVALSRELALLSDCHDAPGEDLRRLSRQFDLSRFADVERAEVGFLDVHPRPDRREIVDGHYRHARRDPFADLERFRDDDAVHRSFDLRIDELVGIQFHVRLGAEHVGFALLD